MAICMLWSSLLLSLSGVCLIAIGVGGRLVGPVAIAFLHPMLMAGKAGLAFTALGHLLCLFRPRRRLLAAAVVGVDLLFCGCYLTGLASFVLFPLVPAVFATYLVVALKDEGLPVRPAVAALLGYLGAAAILQLNGMTGWLNAAVDAIPLGGLVYAVLACLYLMWVQLEQAHALLPLTAWGKRQRDAG